MRTYIRENLWWIAMIAALIVLVIILFIYVLHPILGTPFMKFEQCQGLKYYTTGEYLEFEKGSLFEEMLSSYEFTKNCHVTDFYYSDNRYKDSVVYGKKPDVYGVMLDPGDDYEKIKTQIEEQGKLDSSFSTFGEMLDVYLMPQRNNENIELVFVVGHDTNYLSFIMVSEISKNNQSRSYTTIIDVILFWSTLPFETKVAS